MKSEHNKTLIKFREVENKFDIYDNPLIFSEYYFIYPAFIYDFKHIIDNKDNNNDYLSKVDSDNVDLMFKEILKYNEELRLLWQRGEIFDAVILKTRYRKTKAFYQILCKFLLETISMFYYSKLWEYNYDDDLNFQDCFGPESKGLEFSFDKAFEYAMQLEKVVKAEFNKILDILYPPITEKAIISAVVGKNESEQAVSKELDKKNNHKKHKSHHKIKN